MKIDFQPEKGEIVVLDGDDIDSLQINKEESAKLNKLVSA